MGSGLWKNCPSDLERYRSQRRRLARSCRRLFRICDIVRPVAAPQATAVGTFLRQFRRRPLISTRIHSRHTPGTGLRSYFPEPELLPEPTPGAPGIEFESSSVSAPLPVVPEPSSG